MVVSNSVQNLSLDSLVAVPISSRAPEILPLRLKMHISGLKTTAYAVIPGIRQLKRSRILGSIGILKEVDLARLDDSIRSYLSDTY